MDCYYKLRQLFYYKVRHGLLQIATGITKCDGFITNRDSYYKVRWLLQIATVQFSLEFPSFPYKWLALLVSDGHVEMCVNKLSSGVAPLLNWMDVEILSGVGEDSCFKMRLEFLSCVQTASLSACYDNIILKAKQIICLESLYLKKDLLAFLSTGYKKSWSICTCKISFS